MEATLQLWSFLYRSQIISFNKFDNQEYDETLICIGESTTGMGLTESYPSQLQMMLDQFFPQKKIKVINAGQPGEDSYQIYDHLPRFIKAHNPTLAILMVGINDGIWKGKIKERVSFNPLFNKLLGWSRISKLYHLMKLNFEQIKQSKIDAARKDSRISSIAMEGSVFPHAKFIKQHPEHRLVIDALEKIRDGKINSAIQDLDIFAKSDAQLLCDFFYLSTEGFTPTMAKLTTRYCELAQLHNPNDIAVYKKLFNIYTRTQMWDLAKNTLDTIKKVPGKEVLHFNLTIDYYYRANRIDEARGFIFQHFKNINAHNLKQKVYQGTYAPILRSLDLVKTQEAERIRNLLEPPKSTVRTTSSKKPRFKSDFTTKNYRSIANYLKAHGVDVFAMEYPNLKVKNLKTRIQGLEIPIVSNYQPFNEMLKSQPWDMFFTDRFAGDFGHFTKFGAQLVAINVIQSLVENGVLKDNMAFQVAAAKMTQEQIAK